VALSAPAPANRDIALRVDVAFARIVDQTVDEAVDRVTFCHDLVGHKGQLCRRDRRYTERFLIPHRADREASLIQPRRVGNNAVEVFGKTLRRNFRLASVRTQVMLRARVCKKMEPKIRIRCLFNDAGV
jgi:hypothetical protein